MAGAKNLRKINPLTAVYCTTSSLSVCGREGRGKEEEEEEGGGGGGGGGGGESEEKEEGGEEEGGER